MSHKRFPPLGGHILVPVSSIQQALAGLSLYTPSRRRGLLLRSAAERWVRLLGPRALPGRRVSITTMPIAGGWDGLEALLRREVGPFDAVAVHFRRRPHRPGAAILLLSHDRPLAFVKIGPDSGIENEQRVLALMDRSGRPPAFEAPLPLGLHTIGETRVAAMTVIPHSHHRPMARPPLAEVIEDVQHSLRHLPRPNTIPPHWQPMHGDLSPWNLRIDSAGRVILFDWEEAGFGPPGADEVYYAITSAALGFPRRAVAGAGDEAMGFWQTRLEQPKPNRLRKAMLGELRRLERR